MNENLTPAESASANAVMHATASLEAVEIARKAQFEAMNDETVERMRTALLEGLKEVFGDSDNKNPDQMKVLVARIPILCTSIVQMHDDIAKINENFTWMVRLIIGAVVVAILKLVLIP